ncbi:glycoside hydrolase family 61 protein [Moniliophthora roreri MCA 2997]|uniref:lytic cellulose monooxygenase (C4-dehydrogenating) n=1 Tax=Moniliophthora roreri (strain MCA 2997) TaxID=1381753 RepID=V2WNG8_MONRO|nr:glycoside hydrolase family 61 protein [Moniliophthora roreri MCA 2997]
MVLKLASALTVAAALLPLVNAHGQPAYVEVNGQRYDAPNIYYDGDSKNANTPIRKTYRSDAEAFVYQQDFADNNKMACEGAAGAPGVIKLNAGDSFTWRWDGATPELQNAGFGQNSWVHGQGTVADYIAECTNGDCRTFDASQAGWSKLDLFGIDMGTSITQKLRDGLASKPEPYRATQGEWGLAKLIESDSKWTTQVPSNLKPGQYLLRSELIALHNPLKDGDSTSGPQLYAACAQVEVVNGGSASLPGGVKAGELYQPFGDFARYNVISGGPFTDPGPAVLSLDGSSSNNNNNNNNNSGNNNGNTQTGNQDSNQNAGTGSDNSNNNNGGATTGNNDNNGGATTGSNDNNGGDYNNNNNGENNNNGGENNNNNGGESNGNTDTTTTDNSNNGNQTDNNNNGSPVSTGSNGATCRRRRSVSRRSTNSGRAFQKRAVAAHAAARYAKRSIH